MDYCGIRWEVGRGKKWDQCGRPLEVPASAGELETSSSPLPLKVMLGKQKQQPRNMTY